LYACAASLKSSRPPPPSSSHLPFSDRRPFSRILTNHYLDGPTYDRLDPRYRDHHIPWPGSFRYSRAAREPEHRCLISPRAYFVPTRSPTTVFSRLVQPLFIWAKSTISTGPHGLCKSTKEDVGLQSNAPARESGAATKEHSSSSPVRGPQFQTAR